MQVTFPTFHVDFCDSAGLKIYNGPKSEATLAVEHCGLDNPETFRSSGQMVSIQVSGLLDLKYKTVMYDDLLSTIVRPHALLNISGLSKTD